MPSLPVPPSSLLHFGHRFSRTRSSPQVCHLASSKPSFWPILLRQGSSASNPDLTCLGYSRQCQLLRNIVLCPAPCFVLKGSKKERQRSVSQDLQLWIFKNNFFGPKLLLKHSFQQLQNIWMISHDLGNPWQKTVTSRRTQ